MYTGYYIGSSLLYSIALVLSGFNVSFSRQVALMSWGGEKNNLCKTIEPWPAIFRHFVHFFTSDCTLLLCWVLFWERTEQSPLAQCLVCKKIWCTKKHIKKLKGLETFFLMQPLIIVCTYSHQNADHDCTNFVSKQDIKYDWKIHTTISKVSIKVYHG